MSARSSANGNALLWGLWDISIDPSTKSAKITPLRDAQFTCNVTRFLQPPISNKNLLSINFDPSSEFQKGFVVADMTLTHPFPGLDFYTGFDVRGAVIGDGSVAGIEDPGIIYAGENDLRLLNADGLTRWFNPVEFTTYGKLFGFIQGNQGTPSSDFTATLNGYKYFCDGLDKDSSVGGFFADPSCVNPRGCFPAGSSQTRRYELQFPLESGVPKYHFQYAVVASWLPPNVNPPKNIPGDFPISANCAEAFEVSATDLSDLYYVNDNVKGGNLCLNVQVFDHQGSTNPSGVPGEIGAIVLETPSGLINSNLAKFDGSALDSALIEKDNNSATYSLVVPNATPSSAGPAPVLIAIESADPCTYDSGISGFAYPADAKLTSYSSVTVSVEGNFGWARTWGGELDEGYTNVGVDAAGNCYVAGDFGGTVDFDPVPAPISIPQPARILNTRIFI